MRRRPRACRRVHLRSDALPPAGFGAAARVRRGPRRRRRQAARDDDPRRRTVLVATHAAMFDRTAVDAPDRFRVDRPL